MVKYIKYNKVQTENTVLEFKSFDESVRVNNFDNEVVSLFSEDVNAIDTLIGQQFEEIDCTEITYDEFKALVQNSDQIKRINEQVKAKIAKKYDIADEIAMSKKAIDDEKRVAYETYVAECIAFGDTLKEELGY